MDKNNYNYFKHGKLSKIKLDRTFLYEVCRAYLKKEKKR